MVAEPGCSTASAVMAEYLQRVGEQPSELPVEEVNLLSAVFKNADDSRRAAWRVITSAEQEEKSKGKEQLASHAREYVAKVEGELQKIRDGILALMDKNLIRLACTDELKVFYYRMKSDYYQHLAEFATGEAKSKDVEDLEADTMKHSSIPETAVLVEKTHGGSVWTADHTCGRREAAGESGEQPEEQPNRLETMMGSDRPSVKPKRQRGRNGERTRKKTKRECAVKTLCT